MCYFCYLESTVYAVIIVLVVATQCTQKYLNLKLPCFEFDFSIKPRLGKIFGMGSDGTGIW